MSDRLALLVDELGKLDLSDDEAERLAVAVNAELGAIQVGRDVASSIHVVRHDIVEKRVKRTREVHDKGKLIVEAFDDVDRTNTRDDCPDCHRPLIAARDGDTLVQALVCARLAGIPLAPAGLTAHDIIACGIPG